MLGSSVPSSLVIPTILNRSYQHALGHGPHLIGAMWGTRSLRDVRGATLLAKDFLFALFAIQLGVTFRFQQHEARTIVLLIAFA